jgi:amino acid adenylation domain-containing protein
MQDVLAGFPLSISQKHIWLMQRENTIYRSQRALMMHGALKVACLRQAILLTVERYDILRTTFQSFPGMLFPVQVIAEEPSMSWHEVDLCTCLPEQQAARIEEIFDEERAAPFDFAQGPLLHACLIALDGNRHILLLSLPAVCADRQTLTSLTDAIFRAYSALLEGKKHEMEDEQIQYMQFVNWRNELQTETADTYAVLARSFWRKMYHGASQHALRLPFEQAPAAKVPFVPETLCIPIDHDLTRELISLSQRYQIVPSVILFACWHCLLQRLTQETNTVVGWLADGRGYEQLRDVPGLFAWYVPVPCHFEEESRFQDIVLHLDQVVRNISDMQEYFSWEQGEPGESPWEAAPICFDWDEQDAVYRIGDLAVSLHSQHICIDYFTLKLSCRYRNGTLTAEFHYDPAIYQDGSIQRTARAFSNLLRSALAAPLSPVKYLDLLDAEERHQLLFSWNQSDADYERDVCFHTLFEQQAERTPDRLAVVSGDQCCTYAQLNAKANQIAYLLCEQGVKPGAFVGLFVERSIEFIVGILAVLKAGGAYVPLDPAHPWERSSRQLAELGVKVVLTQETLWRQGASYAGLILCLDGPFSCYEDRSTANLPCRITPAYPVYVMHTSGSTGTAKGVVITHQNLVNYARYIGKELLGEGAVGERAMHMAMVSSPSVDLGNTMIFPALLAGHCLYLPAYSTVLDGESFTRLLVEEHIEVLKIVPSHLNALLATAPTSAISLWPCRYIILGGEALSWELYRRLKTLNSSVELINHYGPTETTVGALWNRSEDWRLEETTSSYPIGRPLANMQVSILDRHLQMVPVGVPGEIYIAGDGLAPGYWHRPDITAERFLPCPWSREPGARFYRTGDQARYLPDGNIEFLGRIDQQIKIRGYRVELGEIAAVLTRSPDIADAVVLVSEEEAPDKHLIACCIAHKTKAVRIGDVQDYAREHLPDYMVPRVFCILDAFPLTPTGKLDRKALLASAKMASRHLKAAVAPRNDIEGLLATIWANLLDRDVASISIDSNFFDLGGHSLLATQMVSRVRNTFHISLPLSEIFEMPVLADLARRIAQIRQGDRWERISEITPVARDGNFPLSFAQQRLWFLDQLNPASTYYNIPLVALRLRGSLDIAIVQQCIDELMRRHETLRTTFPTVDGQPTQVIASPYTLPLVVKHLDDLPEEAREAEVHRIAHEEARRPFDLAHGPLLRVLLLCLDKEEHVLLLSQHHIVSDGWSFQVLLREFAALYSAFSSGEVSPLPDSSIQYVDFALWQRQRLQHKDLQDQLTYWQRQLGGDLPTLALPTTYPRPAVQTFRGATHYAKMPPSMHALCKKVCQQESVTLFMLMMSVFQTLLYRYCGQEDFAVGTFVANREHQATEGLIGFMVNTLVLRADLSGNPTFRELLKRVRKVALEAFDNQEYPFDKLIEVLQPQRSVSHAPLFRVAFVYNEFHAPFAHIELPDIAVEQLEIENEIARLDLTLSMWERSDHLYWGFEYNTDLFEEETITRLLEHFQHLLENCLAHPQWRLSNLSMLSEQEERDLLQRWNQTRMPLPEITLLHELFEQQEERTPDAIALSDEAAAVSYREVNRRANRLAHALRRLGVGPETRVGVCLRRSPELVCSLLAVLKAGGAYVPLEPDYPQERLKFLLHDAQVEVILTVQEQQERLGVEAGRMLDVEQFWLEQMEEPECNPVSGAHAENLAYVIYTSGSTGQPKGAMIAHRSICNCLLWLQRSYQLNAQDRVLQKTPFSFDVSVCEFFWPLLNGARLVLACPEGHQDSAYLVDIIRLQQITTIHFLPVMLQAFLAEPDVDACQSLLHVFCGGEALSKALQESYFSHVSSSLFNLYGPTEASVDVTYWNCEKKNDGLYTVPIGYPIDNMQVYLLDKDLHPVPIGVPGELHISGIGLARGYLNRPDLSAEKFLPDPFSQLAGTRMYKTGDRARYLKNGAIEYLGRVDYQVKVRGYRIELGEVEATLQRHPLIRDAVVLAKGNTSEEMYLAAYIVLKEPQACSIRDIRDFLKARLPDYLLPAHYLFLDELPLTSTGKVHRSALPAPGDIRQSLETPFVQPQTEMERLIATIWRDVLSVEKVGIYDNFFDLGGHSLILMKAYHKLREVTQKDVAVLDLFLYPTVATLAAHLARNQEEESSLLQKRLSRAQMRRDLTTYQRQKHGRLKTRKGSSSGEK